MSNQSFYNILIMGHSNIGDVYCNLAVVHVLKKNFPQARITFLTSNLCRNIVDGYQGVDEVVAFDKKSKSGWLTKRVKAVLRLRKNRFDLVVVLKRTVLHHFLGVRTIWNINGHLKGRISDQNRHAVDTYLDFLKSMGLSHIEAVFHFHISGEDERYADSFLNAQGVDSQKTIIGVFPLAAWTLKNWPVERWNDLIHQLTEKYGVSVIAFGKSGAFPYSEKVTENLTSACTSAIDQTTLPQAMALLKRCDLFIGPDSSLLHLASFMHIEAVGLYGPTSQDYNVPYFHRQNILVVDEKPSCMPCYPGPENRPCKDVNRPGACMKDLPVEKVLRFVEEKLGMQESNLL